MLTIEELREIIAYDPDTGLLTWKRKTGDKVVVGSVAGCLNPKGYIRLMVNKHWMLAHRAAWAIYHGEWPARQIDHINGDKSDNRLVNLRQATPSQNGHNRGPQINNLSGYKGVHRRGSRWAAQIKVGGRHIRLGTWPTAEEAAAAYDTAVRLFVGEFGKTNGEGNE
jgi:HNH endonuclease/AP2 domain